MRKSGERLVKENQDKDALINSQQNELNKASSTIARLRDDIEKKDKEMKRMGDRIESLEDKIISVATENKKEAESKAEPQESQSVPQADKKDGRYSCSSAEYAGCGKWDSGLLSDSGS